MAKWVRVLGITSGLWWGACSLVNLPEEPLPVESTGSGDSSGCIIAADCGTDSDCLKYLCTDGACSEEAQPQGTACSDDGSICDTMGKCVPASCMDGFKDGDESDVDCGGACSPCENGKDCNQAVDCQSGYCPPVNGQTAGTCTACTENPQCPSDQWCSVPSSGNSNNSGGSGGSGGSSSSEGGSGGASTQGGSCVADQAQGSNCDSDDECEGNVNCVDNTCCNVAACSTCETCTTGSCVSVISDDDPDSCPVPSSSCDATGQCLLNEGESCTDGNLCLTGNCVDGTCCEESFCSTCRSCISGSCSAVLSADDPDSCTSSSTCNAAGDCVDHDGQSCTKGTACLSTYCADGHCCNSACNSPCQTCDNLSGTCSPVTNQDDMNGCTGKMTCNSFAQCLKKNGESCVASGAACASGNCVDSTCCADTVCGECETCASGACTPVTSADDPNSCTGHKTCNAMGKCKLKDGRICNDGTDCASGNCVDGTCCNASDCGSCESCANLNGSCQTVPDGPDDSCMDERTCVAGKCLHVDGQTCSLVTECASGHCVDGTCCNASACGSCEECSAGVCNTLINADDDSCNGTSSCSTTGSCLLDDGQACTAASQCASGYCLGSSCWRPASCGELKHQTPSAASGFYSIDPDGVGNNEPYQVDCDMSKGGYTKIGSVAIAPYKMSYLGYHQLGLSDLQSTTTQTSFINSHNTHGGLPNLQVGFVAGDCCVSLDSTSRLTLGGFKVAAALPSGAVFCNPPVGYTASSYRIVRYMSAADGTTLPSNYFTVNPPAASSTICNDNNNPGYFIGNTIVIDHYARGFWSGSHGGAHNGNTLTGWLTQLESDLYNSYFTFNLSALNSSHTITRAELHLELEKFSSDDAFEIVAVWDVSTPTNILHGTADPTGNPYDDLMAGHRYGETTIYATQEGNILVIPLDGQAMTDIQNAAGGNFSVGLELNTADTSSKTSEYVRFGKSITQTFNHQLVIYTQ